MPPKPGAAPRLGKAGRTLWKAILDEYELAEHETVVLREACRTADSLDDLQALLVSEGLMAETSQGPRIHPALVELRQQRIALARLFAALHIPVTDESSRTQHRGARGVYGVAG